MSAHAAYGMHRGVEVADALRQADVQQAKERATHSTPGPQQTGSQAHITNSVHEPEQTGSQAQYLLHCAGLWWHKWWQMLCRRQKPSRLRSGLPETVPKLPMRKRWPG